MTYNVTVPSSLRLVVGHGPAGVRPLAGPLLFLAPSGRPELDAQAAVSRRGAWARAVSPVVGLHDPRHGLVVALGQLLLEGLPLAVVHAVAEALHDLGRPLPGGARTQPALERVALLIGRGECMSEVASSLLQHGFQPIRLVPSDGGSQELALCWADSLDCANY